MHTKLTIACEMKTREVQPYSDTPTYEVLLYRKGFKTWQTLCMSDGKPARFDIPPLNEEHARQIIREHEATYERPL